MFDDAVPGLREDHLAGMWSPSRHRHGQRPPPATLHLPRTRENRAAADVESASPVELSPPCPGQSTDSSQL